MVQPTTQLLFGGPYTQRGSFGFGALMFIIGGALLFWETCHRGAIYSIN